jgi:hypothetical protein
VSRTPTTCPFRADQVINKPIYEILQFGENT